ncbi:MAG TPA: DUF475 domain-containing protein [Candidatus Pacearchaeota archaeon]|nr:DUF475 domain-containing protein [Candidatus Parcubacteria bacterium]HNP79382.1 DUF475 domain-containing protein [Candidatus Pacearchaeota archaeon]HOC53812.1 DUF475 domain-containing protein [Candidatus Pacearchaeota archaeon]HQM24570.1 DUF475 domain-containing protein [Candidatus Pacearchaeota archaeon]
MILESLVIIIGLCIFETLCSIDNAIVNANVLKTVSDKYRKIFLFWGIIFAVFVVRGLLPFLIVWITDPSLSFIDVIAASFTSNDMVAESLEASKPLLLLGGGAYLFLVFLSWLFLEEKNCLLLVERFIHRQGVWFYAIASLFTTATVYFALKVNPILALALTIGVSAFFITDGFKKSAEEKEKELMQGNLSAWSKLLYLEVLDASFSIDGVIGAFAFTTSIPLILIGNGLGAFIVRDLTLKGIDKISQYAYLKNGAMYSIGVLGSIMILESFGQEFPFWLVPLCTISILSLFFYVSVKENKKCIQ